MYSSIANYYDFIFPVDKIKTDFIGSFLPHQSANILDIGCSTGGFLPFLIDKGHKAFGIDLNNDMILLAKNRVAEQKQKDRIAIGNMLNLDLVFVDNSFHLVYCLGNTIAHLKNIGELDLVINNIYKRLNNDGKLIFQVVNYDRFDADKESVLPLIENDVVKFEREYNWHREDSRVSFNTKLTVKETGELFENIEVLTPFLPDEILRRIESYGFKINDTYGDFKKSPFNSESSFAFIVIAEKIL